MYFDTHAHYDAEEFAADRYEVLQALPDSGVELVLNPGCDIPSSQAALALADRFPHVYAAVGCHPENCAGYREEDLVTLRELARHPKCVAIGEIGLDYYWPSNPPRPFQQKVFCDQLALASEIKKPVIVHDREAHRDCLEIIRDFPLVTGVFHCFSGSADMARELVKLGWMISFTGVLTYKNARRAVEAARETPMERIMLETDSPYMAPIPRRGERNDSRNLPYICQVLADIKGISLEECARTALENGKRFFSIAPLGI